MTATQEMLEAQLNELRLDRASLEDAVKVLKKHTDGKVEGFRAVTIIEMELLISTISTKVYDVQMQLAYMGIAS